MAIVWYKWLLLFTSLLGKTGANENAAGHRHWHPLYISVTELTHNAKEKTLEVSCKIFADDFEKVLSAQSKTKTDLTNPADKAAIDRQITIYITKHLSVRLDGKPVTLTYMGFEKENDAVWSYFQAENITTVPKKIEITNSLLYDSYEKEINLMHVTVGGQRKSTRLDNPATEAKLEF